jgi:hypothetical protein
VRRSSVADQHARVKPAAADRWTEQAHLGGAGRAYLESAFDFDGETYEQEVLPVAQRRLAARGPRPYRQPVSLRAVAMTASRLPRRIPAAWLATGLPWVLLVASEHLALPHVIGSIGVGAALLGWLVVGTFDGGFNSLEKSRRVLIVTTFVAGVIVLGGLNMACELPQRAWAVVVVWFVLWLALRRLEPMALPTDRRLRL